MTQADIHLSVADAYDRWSGLYDDYENPTVWAATRVVAELVRDAAGKSLLEFGCGTGRNLAAFRAAGAAPVVGLDLSPGMLEQARARDPAFELHLHDMSTPAPVPDNSFDLVLFCLTLEHVADLLTPFKQARRVLKSGGTITVLEIHPFLSLNGVGAHFEEGGETVRMPVVTHIFADYVNAAVAVGLSVEACREWRACDLGPDLPERMFRRGPDAPRLVQFTLRPRYPA